MLVPLGLFRYPNFALGVSAVFTLGFTVYSINLPIMLYLQEAQGLSAEVAGLMLLPMGLVSVVMAPIIGRITDRVSPGGSPGSVSPPSIAMLLFGVLMHRGIGAGWVPAYRVIALGIRELPVLGTQLDHLPPGPAPRPW